MMNLTVTEYKNIRVLTTQQIAEAYETDKKTISYNFNHNKERYKEGKHYIPLEGEEKKEFLNRLEIHDGSQNAKVFYLWTEKGAFLHAKSLNTDIAWDVYDRLVDSYFNKGMQKDIDTEELSPELQMFGKLYEVVARQELKQKEQDKRIEQIDSKVDSIKEVVALNPNDWRKDTSNIINKIALHVGGYEHIKAIREESYKLLEQRMGVALNIRLTNKKKTMSLNGVCRSKVDKLNQLDVIADDKKLIEGYVAIVKDMAIHYGLADIQGVA